MASLLVEAQRGPSWVRGEKMVWDVPASSPLPANLSFLYYSKTSGQGSVVTSPVGANSSGSHLPRPSDFLQP